MRTGAQALIEGLKQQGAEVVFGIPGGAVLAIYDELSHAEIKHILTRSEQGAAHAAAGYAKASGRVGVCLTSSGPGATNLVTGLANAYMDSIPLVAITGQVPRAMVGTDAFQEVDITGITQPITKHNYLVTNADDIPRIIAEAFYIAGTGRKGPVLVDIPSDVANSLCHKEAPAELDLPGYKPNYKGHPAQIRLAASALSKAQKPLIYAGGGVISAQASAELLALAEAGGIPVVTSLMGKGAIKEDNPLCLGMLGIHGLPAANWAAMHCDTLLVLGGRFSDRVMGDRCKFAPEATIIHIDIDPAEIAKNIAVRIPIVGDLREIVKEISAEAKLEPQKDWLAELEEAKDRNILVFGDRRRNDESGEELLDGGAIIDKLTELTEGKAIITTDVGQHQMTAARHYHPAGPGLFISSGGLGTMGFGLPAALGAQIACPEQTVICVTGDGSLQMTLNEMATIKSQKLPVKILLFNNKSLGLVRQLQHTYCDENYFAVDMVGNPNFLMLAMAYGFENLRIEDPGDIEPTLKKALNNGKPTLIDCSIPKDEMILPIVKKGQSLNEMSF